MAGYYNYKGTTEISTEISKFMSYFMGHIPKDIIVKISRWNKCIYSTLDIFRMISLGSEINHDISSSFTAKLVTLVVTSTS